MKKIKIMLAFIMLFASTSIFAQASNEKLVGKWKTEDKVIVEFAKNGTSLTVKQISAEKEKDRKDNGKMIGKDIVFSSGDEFKGTVIDPSNGKEYKGTWIMAADGKSVKLKVKWGLLNFSETWIRQ
jgi:uncharacterized protein (DUF2147 family)